MKEPVIAHSCTRGSDLISYLYREASESESREFEKHVLNCASCKQELSGFGYIRDSIDIWRQESLGLTLSNTPAVPASNSSMPSERKRTALAALREFFTLSPVWMRAAVAMTAMAFCALGAIDLMHMVDGPEIFVVESPGYKINAQEESDLRVARATSQAAEVALNALPNQITASHDAVKIVHHATPARQFLPQGNFARANTARRVRPDLSMPRDSTLAEFMPFTHTEEERAPRLSDLMDYVSN